MTTEYSTLYETEDQLFSYHHIKEIGRPTDVSIVEHSHLHYEIIYMLEGKMSCLIEGKIYQITPGDILLIRAHDFHVLTLQDEQYARRVIEFAPSFLPIPAQQRNTLLAPYNLNNKNFDSLIPSKVVSLYGLDKIFEKIGTAVETESSRDLYVSIYLMNMLLELNNIQNSPRSQDHFTYTSSTVMDIIGYIDEHLTDKISLDDLQSALHLSKFYISHLFKQVMGTTLANYIMAKKIRYAEKLILDGLSPTHAAAMIGYNYSNFYVNYKRITHTSPSKTKGNGLKIL